MNKLHLAAFFVALGAVLSLPIGTSAPAIAQTAPTPCPLPYPSLQPNTTILASQINANNAALASCQTNAFSNITKNNIGPLGLAAPNLKPATQAEATFSGPINYAFANPLQVNGGALTPVYDLTGNASSATLHAIRVGGISAATIGSCGPFSGSFCATVTFPASIAFTSVTSTATSYECGGGAAIAGNGYWLRDFTQFAVEWNTPTILYVLTGAASVPFTFTCEGY